MRELKCLLLWENSYMGHKYIRKNLETLLIFPSARTTALIWDLDKGLNNLNLRLRIFLVETNGLPNFSDGTTPDINSLGYGHWANEIFENLTIKKAFTHTLSPEAEQLLVEYQIFALTRYKDNTQKPYYMGKQLEEVKVDTYLLEGDRDLLFPYKKSVENAKKGIKTLVDVKVFENVGHGIETYHKAMNHIGEKIKNKP